MVISPDADPDGDGRPNALEAFLGSDPLVIDSAKWYTLILSGTDLTLRRNRKNGDLINLIGYTYQEVKLARSTLSKRFIRLELETP